MERKKFEKEWFGNKIILENNIAYCAYDASPVSLGHCLVIPNRHIESFFELSDEEICGIYDLIKKVKSILQEKYNPDWYNVWLNEWLSAGRSVHHLHIHIIPRYKWDVENPVWWIRNIIPWKWDYTKTFIRE